MRSSHRMDKTATPDLLRIARLMMPHMRGCGKVHRSHNEAFWENVTDAKQVLDVFREQRGSAGLRSCGGWEVELGCLSRTGLAWFELPAKVSYCHAQVWDEDGGGIVGPENHQWSSITSGVRFCMINPFLHPIYFSYITSQDWLSYLCFSYLLSPLNCELYGAFMYQFCSLVDTQNWS